MSTKNMIELSNLRRTYHIGTIGEVRAINEVNLKVPEGEFLTILGPSGSGKTTLLNLIGGLDKPTQGEIILNGQELSKLNEEKLVKIRRENVGFVFQSFNLIPTFSALENVEAALAPTGMPKNVRLQRSMELLRLMSLENRSNHLPAELSAGEQQRVAIARSFANKPRILLLDEPTGNLDTETGKAIMEICHRISKDLSQTVVAVSHAGYVRGFTDRLLFMRDGRLFSQIPKEES